MEKRKSILLKNIFFIFLIILIGVIAYSVVETTKTIKENEKSQSVNTIQNESTENKIVAQETTVEIENKSIDKNEEVDVANVVNSEEVTNNENNNKNQEEILSKEEEIKKENKENVQKEVQKEVQKNVNQKIVYLTFDDGPSENTLKILEILKKNDIKATFFVIGKNINIYKKIIEDGHEIGLHSYSHVYNKIYSSEIAFFNDLYKLRDIVKKETGKDVKVTRFPGGSSTKKLTNDLRMRIIRRLNNEGFVYQDWNCDSSDASANNVDVSVILKNSTSCSQNKINILMHDTLAKKTTVDALQDIINDYKNRGYTFEALTKDSPKFQHVKIKKKK